MEKGWTIGIAHIRGGSEKGRQWHKQAQFGNRDRGWKDLEECVAYLLMHGYTHPSLLFLCTHSAGAIVGWQAINSKPHLYKGLILKFPFLDVLTGLLDEKHPLAQSDHDEFGNPIADYSSFQEIEAISPYETISRKEYPLIHIVAGENDFRTPLPQILKFVRRFRQRALSNNRLSEELGGDEGKGVTVDISKTASHLGEGSAAEENLKGCDMFGYMDYVINRISKDCKLEE